MQITSILKTIEIYSEEKVISRVLVSDSLHQLEQSLSEYSHIFAVMDKSVALYSPAATDVAGILNRRNVPGKLIEVSEDSKTLETVMDICSWLMGNGADRDTLVLAVGGGITSDMVGFAASIYKRGVRFAYVPTTLLSQVDAAIGGKTGVNFERYKNILGVIRQPEFTYVCPRFLESLPLRDFLSGAAEMLKTFVIEDGGCYLRAVRLLSDMVRSAGSVHEGAPSWSEVVCENMQELTQLVAAAAQVKAGVVSRDQFESGERRKLNLGHTFAHAVETLTRKAAEKANGGHPVHTQEFGGITHGEAVAMGMVLAARLSDRLAGNNDEVGPLESAIDEDLRSCGIPSVCPYTVEEMADAMRKDKKAEDGKVHFVVPQSIGNVVICDLTVDEVLELLRES